MPPIGPRNEARKRATHAYELRCMGRTWDSIATELNYGSHRSAFNAVRKHIERMPAEDQDIARAFSAGTYKLVAARLFDVADMAERQGKPHTAVMALDAAAQATAKHDALQGLNRPVTSKVEHTVHHNATELIESAREQMRALTQQQPAINPPQPSIQPQLHVIEGEVLP